MKKVKKILFPTDFSDASINAFRYALWFADKYQATIELWHFVAPELAPADIPVVSAELTQQKVEIAKDVLKTFTEAGMTQVQIAHELSNVPVVHGYVEVGSAATYIGEKAKESEVDLIIMGTQGEHNSFEKIFGSVTTDTIGKSHCPVLVIPDHFTTDKISAVAFSTDLREADTFHIWELTKVLSPFKPMYKVVHVEEEDINEEDLEMSDLRQFFLDKSPTVDISFHSLIGDEIVELLENFIKNHKVDLLVMYKPKRGFFERLFHTSLTKKLVLHADVPLLILK